MRSRILKCLALAASAYAASAFAQSTPPVPPARTAAFREATFGIAIRWGLYSIPAGEWKGQLIPGPAERIMRDARIPVKEYEQLASQFNPAHFDAESWVKFAEEAGAKYLIVTAKDRDGFAMYRSAASRFNVFDATPFHRDPLRELAEACAKHKLKLGVSYSQAEDWHESNGGEKAEPQVRELLTGYGPLSLLAFDPPVSDKQAQRFLALAHSLQPAALLDLGSTAGDYVSIPPERIPPSVLNATWQVSQTVNRSGGFNKYDNDWKSVDDLIFNLVDIVSKGGNYVIEIGPTADGVIPRPSLVTLQSLGEWLKLYGEAIYGAGPTAFGDEFTASAQIKWRCTTKPDKLFLTLFQWPDGPLELSNVKAKITKAYLLADASHTSLAVTQSGGRVTVALPKDPPIVGAIPDRLNRQLMMQALRAHVGTVLVLETAGR